MRSGCSGDLIPAVPFARSGRSTSAKVKPLPKILSTAPGFRARPRSKAPGGLRVSFGRVLYLIEPEGYPKPLPMNAVFWPDPVPGKSIPVLPAVTKKRLRSTTVPRMWIMDTGCGRDLIGKNDLSRDDLRKCRPAKDPVTFDAAGAQVNADVTLSLESKALGEAIDAYVLERCPAALNVGGRCRKRGYKFLWDHYAPNAELTLPDRTTKIVLENHYDVAFLREWQGEDSEPGMAAFPLHSTGGASGSAAGTRKFASARSTELPEDFLCQP